MRFRILMLLPFFFAFCGKDHVHFQDNLNPPIPVKNFSLLDTEGREMDLFRSLQSKKIVILFFGYSHCPDICINVLNKLSQVMKNLDEPSLNQIEIIFISIDPKRDSGFLLKPFLAQFNPRIIAVTGRPEELEEIKSNYKIFATQISSKDNDSKTTEFAHSTNLLWITPDLKVKKSVPQSFQVLNLVEEIRFQLRKK